jgi:hypothetical protein
MAGQDRSTGINILLGKENVKKYEATVARME